MQRKLFFGGKVLTVAEPLYAEAVLVEDGKYADFALLDDDPLAVPKENLRDLRVLATYKNGECVYKQ